MDAVRDDPSIGSLVSLHELKSHLRVSSAAEDDVLDGLLKAASQYTEDLCGRSLIEQAWTWTVDTFVPSRSALDAFWYGSSPSGAAVPVRGIIRIPRPPLVSIESIKYLDEQGDLQTLDAARYQVDNVTEPGRIMLARGDSWPTTGDYMGAVQVKFTAGYAVLPHRLALAVKQLAAHWYANREAIAMPGLSGLPLGYDALISDHRMQPW